MRPLKQCAVVGKPDPDVGEFPVAFIQLREGAQAAAEDIMTHVSSQVAPYKKVREVYFQTIPVSAAGKVMRKGTKGTIEIDRIPEAGVRC